MRMYRADRFDRLFPFFAFVSVMWLVLSFISTVVQKTNPYFSLLLAIIVFVFVLIWGFARKTKARPYSQLIFQVLIVVVAIVQVLAYDKLLPSILTDNQDRNELILSLITYYVVLAGVTYTTLKRTCLSPRPLQ